jgi:probable phosphoglycerate mutase
LSGLREINLGAWEGLAVSDVQRRFPEAYEARGAHLAGFRPPGGESFTDLQKRVVPVFEGILCGPGSPVLVVGHAGVNRVILCHVLGMPLENLFRIEQPYGAMSIITPGGGPLKVRSLGLPAMDNALF